VKGMETRIMKQNTGIY